MPEIRRSSGVYLVMPDSTIARYADVPVPERSNFDRLRYKTVIREGQTPSSLWIGRVHGNEGESAALQENLNDEYPFSRVEAWTAHERAAKDNSREYVMPINGGYDTMPGPVIHQLGGHLAKVIDLNRQYVMPQSLAGDWESVLGNIAYPPARLLLQLVRDNPGIQALISIHEDLEHTNYSYPFVRMLPRIKKLNGFYLYDARVHDNDPYDAAVDRQMNALRKAMKANGFTLYNGMDDTDPHLRNMVRNGFVRQSVYDRDGVAHLDSTIELFLVYLASLGLGNVKRSFTIEVPGKMSAERKKQLLKTVTETFFFPVLGEMGAL